MLLHILLKSEDSYISDILKVILTKIRISNPEVKAPWAISMAMLFTYIAGFLFNIVLCFCMVCISSLDSENPYLELPIYANIN